MAVQDVMLAVGPNGLVLHVPDGMTLLPVGAPADSAAPLGPVQQTRLLAGALNAPDGLPALKTLAQAHRRVALVAGDLSFPAPYERALLAVIEALVEGGIRPSRISVLTCPGANGPVLGRGAIHRYGEAVVGDHEFRAWTPEETGGADPFYAAADLKLAVSSVVAGQTAAQRFSAVAPPDGMLELTLGRKTQIDIVAARFHKPADGIHSPAPSAGPSADVHITSGGGHEWEDTLEEALLSLHHARISGDAPATAVLAFSGEDGLGSARFTQDIWSLLTQAEDVLAETGALPPPEENSEIFDSAGTLASALQRHARVVLLAPGFAGHIDAEDLRERLAALPNMSQRLKLCGAEAALWPLLAQWHGAGSRVAVNPLGWRA